MDDDIPTRQTVQVIDVSSFGHKKPNLDVNNKIIVSLQ